VDDRGHETQKEKGGETVKKLMFALTALFIAVVLWGGIAVAGMSPAFASPLPANNACDHALANAQHDLPFNTCVERP